MNKTDVYILNPQCKIDKAEDDTVIFVNEWAIILHDYEEKLLMFFNGEKNLGEISSSLGILYVNYCEKEFFNFVNELVSKEVLIIKND